MRPIHLFVALLAIGSIAGSTTISAAEGPFDISGVKRVDIDGDASNVHLTTAASQPYQAALTTNRASWFGSLYSLWFFEDCRKDSEITVIDQTLKIRVSSTVTTKFSDCDASIIANVPEGADIVVAQTATKLTLDGRYNSVKLASKFADFRLEGHAANILADSVALKAIIHFTSLENNENITLNSKAVDADIRFEKAPKISYRVEATASTVDSTLENTPGSKPEIDIKAQYARAVIR